jgi:LPXTG-site transpeptidase (sortase) family protein
VGVLGQDADPPAPPEPAATATAAPEPSVASTATAVPAPTATPSATATDAPQPMPVAISIPSIEVSSELITVGLRPDGTLEVPEGPDYDKAAWYEGSPRPGEVGPSVVEGHVDSAENGPSVFYRLGEVRPGDEVVVQREDGTAATFRVDDVRSFPKDDFPQLEVYGNTDGPELRLITCGGDFDGSSGHYVDNTVVFASLVATA